MQQLELEKQLQHRLFCDSIAGIKDIEALKALTIQLHSLMLGKEQAFASMLKGNIDNLKNSI